MKIRQTFPIKLSFISIFILFMLLTIEAFNSHDSKSQFAKFKDLEGPYLGQKPPGMIPEIFAPGYISTEKRELNSVFTPDGKEFYFSISTPGRGYKMYFTRQLEQNRLLPYALSRWKIFFLHPYRYRQRRHLLGGRSDHTGINF